MGSGAVVTVRIAAMPQGLHLEVEDNGPGLPPDLLTTANQPRRGASRGQGAEGQGGHGLGLAITAEIAALFGAGLTLGAGANGRGLRASVVLARAT